MSNVNVKNIVLCHFNTWVVFYKVRAAVLPQLHQPEHQHHSDLNIYRLRVVLAAEILIIQPYFPSVALWDWCSYSQGRGGWSSACCPSPSLILASTSTAAERTHDGVALPFFFFLPPPPPPIPSQLHLSQTERRCCLLRACLHLLGSVYIVL